MRANTLDGTVRDSPKHGRRHTDSGAALSSFFQISIREDKVMKKLTVSNIAVVALVALPVLIALPAIAGEWHTGTTNLCTDCHTMHFSQTHNWDGTTPVSTTPQLDGNWLGATGPNNFLLKLPANQLCLACHDGQTFAPDVLGDNLNGAAVQGRSAGALNEEGVALPGYENWKGHTLGSTANPPGYNPAAVGITTDWYTGDTTGLECINCHTQHGIAGAYRNLGPRTLGTANLPTYAISTTNDNTKDVWINVAAPYTANTGNSANFSPYYDTANVSYNRNDKALGTTNASNAMDTQCATCHGNFHGGPADTTIRDGGTTPDNLDGFIRHPTGGIVMGASGAAGYGGHSTLSRFTGATTKVKVYADDRTAWADATPGCVTCHKAHGNQNPFGLVFLSRTAASVTEQGGYATGQVENPNGYQQGYRNLCGQCHGQGN